LLRLGCRPVAVVSTCPCSQIAQMGRREYTLATGVAILSCILPLPGADLIPVGGGFTRDLAGPGIEGWRASGDEPGVRTLNRRAAWARREAEMAARHGGRLDAGWPPAVDGDGDRRTPSGTAMWEWAPVDTADEAAPVGGHDHGPSLEPRCQGVAQLRQPAADRTARNPGDPRDSRDPAMSRCQRFRRRKPTSPALVQHGIERCVPRSNRSFIDHASIL